MKVPSPPAHGGDGPRILILASLFVAPLAAGATHEPVFVPLLVAWAAAGAWSIRRERARRAMAGDRGARVPGARLLIALHAYILLQLIPLPPRLLRAVSPGTFSFHNDTALVPLASWCPVSVSPADTVRGLAFLAAFSLLYVAVFREFRESRWRRRLLGTVVAAASVLTALTLIQDACPDPRGCGIWPRSGPLDTYGPFGNRHHFAGCLVMAIPLAVGFALEALQGVSRTWAGRRRGWLALGGPEAAAFLRRFAAAALLLAGLLTSRSRGGVVAWAAAAPMHILGFRRHRLRAAMIVVALAAIGVATIGVGDIVEGFRSRGIKASRIELWQDMARLFPRFPLLGVGFNSFGLTYRSYQTVWKYYFVGEAHNEYLQVLLELGILGSLLVAALLGLLFRRAFAAATRAPLEAGILASLLGLAVHNLVDFNWQIPASAATYTALAALAVRGGGDQSSGEGGRAGRSRRSSTDPAQRRAGGGEGEEGIAGSAP
jgi:O-antigen ligase